MVPTTLTTRLIGAGIALVLAMPGAALAKTVCIHSTALGGWTFVLKGASLKPGSSGAASGYAIRDDGFANPISGGFVVFESSIHAGISSYATGLNVNNGTGGATSSTTFHQLAVSLTGGPGSDWSWTGTGSGMLTNASGNATLVDCKIVPAIPKTFA
jgi:hypothetical protein